MKTIVIAGATGGIGKAIARSLCGHGNNIICIGRNQESLGYMIEEMVDEINSSGGSAHSFICDITDVNSIKETMANIVKSHGQINWLINSAGTIEQVESFETESEESLIATLQGNLVSAINLTKYVLPHLQYGGGIINISSTSGIWGNGTYAVYSAAKAGVNTFTQAIARSIESQNLTSIAICPGPTNTAMREKIAGDAEKQQSPEIVAQVVKAIVEHTSPYKNGDVVIVRNGEDKLFSGLNS